MLPEPRSNNQELNSVMIIYYNVKTGTCHHSFRSSDVAGDEQTVEYINVKNSGSELCFDKTTVANATQGATCAISESIGRSRLAPPHLLSRSRRGAVHCCHSRCVYLLSRLSSCHLPPFEKFANHRSRLLFIN